MKHIIITYVIKNEQDDHTRLSYLIKLHIVDIAGAFEDG